ncbi:hypothetical protein FB45DRAFT_554832 [Roridomyces roridus]|uniref:Protein kinase domain-containing protein n=1 Tax=Roridomyces roridus TaxID=1738132 RepID=A0AAD7BUM6_9AGAR|nr:hypothetical protein FB45DRAFT_554832 [Roridomyces roridus]
MEVILHVHTGPTISPSNSSHSATTDDSLSSVSTPPTSPLEEPNSNVTKSYPISVPLPAAPPRLEASTVILIGKESTVWSGLLRGKEVILKAYELNKHAQQSLASEAACYERLSPLGLTPRFLGVYRGQVDSVLLVEHGGKSLTNWSELDDDEKYLSLSLMIYVSDKFHRQAFYTLVRAVHNAGVCHNDITPSNVVRGPQGVRLIDFGESHVGHSCEGTCSELRRLEQVLRTVNV